MAHKVLIVGGKRQSGKLAGILKKEGYTDILLSNDCTSAVEMAKTMLPEVILMDASLPCEDPVSVVRKILNERPAPVIMHSDYNQTALVMEADEAGVVAQFFRPVTRENLLGAIELGMSRYRQCQTLRGEVGDCKEALRVRKLVERAKGILMKRDKITEEEAFLKIQKLSRDSNIKMEKLAESIITANKII